MTIDSFDREGIYRSPPLPIPILGSDGQNLDDQEDRVPEKVVRSMEELREWEWN